MKTYTSPKASVSRRGSTLIIVIALLGLLAFAGMVFFTFASQERAAAEFFSEAEKSEPEDPDNVWDHPLAQIISGPTNRPDLRYSVLRSRDRNLSMISTMVGADLAPHSGDGITVNYSGGLPVVTGPAGNDWINFVDSPAARNGSEDRPVPRPAPDVDYTYPDINNIFLAYKGWAIRDNSEDTNDNGVLDPGEDRDGDSVLDLANPRYERVPVIIPSFFRPQYMKTGASNGFGGNTTPTDINWATAFDGVDRTTGKFGARSFRPHPSHIVVSPTTGARAFRFLTNAENAALTTPLVSGGFPFYPDDSPTGVGSNGVIGELGIWTGSHPGVYELDVDNDGDGIREGIWIDTHFPVQEDSNGKLYTVLHSFTIYDLDGLINLNVHGNLSSLDRSTTDSSNNPKTLKTIAGSGVLSQQFLSRSGMGLGPNEINPLWALRTDLGNPPDSDVPAQFIHHYGKLPTNNVEQANMEWIWLLAGRASINPSDTSIIRDLLAGRWGENERLFNAVKPGGTFLVADLPRPGRSGQGQATGSNGVRYGGTLTGMGRNGFDDNQDRVDGEIFTGSGRVRGFGTPMDYAGTGRTHQGTLGVYSGTSFPLVGDIRLPLMQHDTATNGPERFLTFDGYSLVRDVDGSVPRYWFGQNGTFNNAGGDDLLTNPFLDPLFEDPLESVFDPEFSERDFDRVFGAGDALALHLPEPPSGGYKEALSDRVISLAPYGFDLSIDAFRFDETTSPGVRSRFTTISNSLHRFLLRSPFGADGKPGIAGVDDDGDGFIDNLSDLTSTTTTFVSGVKNANGQADVDTINRAWEFNADTDGADINNDGFPDGDGFLEFPPAFGATATDGKPYSATDPFRPQVRRLLNFESGEGRQILGQMPISPNRILDVDRNQQVPQEGTARFLYHMQRSGLHFRPLVEHPTASEAATIASPLPTWTPANPVAFPPQTVGEREFWARRDRQKLARDIYVLLYTTGGAGEDATGKRLDYTADNDPGAAEGASLYTHDQLRRMAQFAVNMVDAMDTDNVMTRFEYDKNLGNGWGLDDNPDTADMAVGVATDSDFAAVTKNGLYPEDQTVNGTGVPERGVVYGVEAQELAISEAQGIHAAKPASDHPATPFADDAMARDFLYVELQNMRPTTLDLADAVSVNADKAIWRLGRYDRANVSAAVGNPAAPGEEIAVIDHAENVISGGGRFSISVANDTSLASSAFFVDTGDIVAGTFDGTYELIAPDAADITLPTGSNSAGSTDPGYSPLTDIDVIHNDHNGTNGSARFDAPSGNFLDTLVTYSGNNTFKNANGQRTTFDGVSNLGFDLVLHRRANPNMPSLNETENPWIEVDRIRVAFDNFPIADGDTPSMIFDSGAGTGHLASIRSDERREPLDDTIRNDGQPKSTTPYRRNTLKGAAATTKSDLLGVNSSCLPNSTLPVSTTNVAHAFELWQPHFDRDYASTGEFLTLPVVGPSLLTQRLSRMRFPGYQQSFTDPFTPSGVGSTDLLSNGEAMLLFPDFTDSAQTAEIEAARDNRWYRLLQFVEVESRVHKMLGNYLAQTRIPGKININMIRHREVLAGLIDNPFLADVPALADLGEATYEDAPFLTSASALGSRDLYSDFMKNRDGDSVTSWNPTAGQRTRYFIPGTPNARPFRSIGAMGSTAATEEILDQTVLRRLKIDRDDDQNGIDDEVGVDDPESNRHWLELDDVAFHKRPVDSDSDGDADENDEQTNTAVQRHALLSKILNNTTTVSNTFIVYGTAAYFEVYEDQSTGLQQVGGRYDLDKNGDPLDDQQRAVFVIDRTDAYTAFDPGTGDFDWKHLVKARAELE